MVQVFGHVGHLQLHVGGVAGVLFPTTVGRPSLSNNLVVFGPWEMLGLASFVVFSAALV